MSSLTMEKARGILNKHVSKRHLINHALAVSAAMGAMAERFGGDPEHWKAVGYLHDVDFEKYPEEHCGHVRELLTGENIDEADVRAIISHGYGVCTEEAEPLTDMEKSLFTVDELTGLVSACALMRPAGITDLTVKSLKKKFKDKSFAAKCSRDVIKRGCEMLGMPLDEVMELTIKGMKTETDGLGLGAK